MPKLAYCGACLLYKPSGQCVLNWYTLGPSLQNNIFRLKPNQAY